jgi:hypothetical protein
MKRVHKKSARAHTYTVQSRFGSELPSFSYDFSDLFIGAVIERSLDSDELHLAMIVLGQRALQLTADESPFKAISTDMHTVGNWISAGTEMSLGRQNATLSGLSCRLQNDPAQQSYYTTATRLAAHSTSASSNEYKNLIDGNA